MSKELESTLHQLLQEVQHLRQDFAWLKAHILQEEPAKPRENSLANMPLMYEGREMTLGQLNPKVVHILLYVSLDCLGCKSIQAKVKEWFEYFTSYEQVDFHLITKDDPDVVAKMYQCPSVLQPIKPEHMQSLLSLEGTPGCTIIFPHAQMAPPTAGGGNITKYLDAFKKAVTENKPFTPPPPEAPEIIIPPVGTEIPNILVKDLENIEYKLHNFLDQKRLSTTSVVFWGDHSEPSRALNPLLVKMIDKNQVLVVADQDPQLPQQAGFHKNVILDFQNELKLSLGIIGTPIALKIFDKKIASKAIVGSQEISALFK